MSDVEGLRRNAEEIFRAALNAADPGACVRRSLVLSGEKLTVGGEEYDLREVDRVLVVGAGKATAAMAKAAEEILYDRITRGTINTKYGHKLPLDRIEIVECGHPIPDEAGVRGAAKVLDFSADADERTLVLCLMSGGGSALLPAPAEGLTLAEKQETTRLLLECGATINEINAIRKHLSRVKGGHLARAVYPARMATLLLSDVIGDPLDVIASGPTVPDESTFGECLRIVEKYALEDRIPSAVKMRLSEGAAGAIPETPKRGDEIFERCRSVVVGGNRLAVEAARREAIERGYHTLVLTTRLEGETREVAKVYAALAKEIVTNGDPLPRPACVVSGGEPTVTIRGKGKGGRNQEFALAGAIEIQGWDDIVLFSAGTDGTDGPTDAAGAIADGETVARGGALGLSASEYLNDNDSYTFFRALDDLVITGPTGTNVMDVQLVMVGEMVSAIGTENLSPPSF